VLCLFGLELLLLPLCRAQLLLANGHHTLLLASVLLELFDFSPERRQLSLHLTQILLGRSNLLSVVHHLLFDLVLFALQARQFGLARD
jgi:hypothetical protein